MATQKQFLFNLDTPTQDQFKPLSRFSGWYLVGDPQPVDLVLHVNQEPRAALQFGSARKDVAMSYPQWDQAEFSGFYGDVLIPETLWDAKKIDISVWDHGLKNPRKLFEKRFSSKGNYQPPQWRKRGFSLTNLLQCPTCTGELSQQMETWRCNSCQSNGPVRGQAFFFLEDNKYPFQTPTENTNTHPYGEGAHRLLERVGNGLVLDFGAGNSPKSAIRRNTCYLDIKQYAHTDVVTCSKTLPFKDNSFDGIVSQSVFEHLADPFHAARELYRILKPGGHIYVDTAFMQPLHGDPSHYFNMTQYGLRRVFEMFAIERIDVAPHHLPSYGLIMQLDTLLPNMANGVWKQRLENLRMLLGTELQSLEADLNEKAKVSLAAGWFVEGRKPEDGAI